MYIIKREKYTKDKKYKPATIPLYCLIGLLIVQIGYILLAKELVIIHYDKETTISVSACSESGENPPVTETEQALLSMVKDIMKPSDKAGWKKSQGAIYYDVLKEYFEKNHAYMTLTQLNEVKEKLVKIQEILTGEKQTDYTGLSLDGKKIAFYLMEQIYKDMGLRLEGNSEGVIIKISSHDGNILYNSNPIEHMAVFRWDALLVMIICNSILFIICLTIARRNRLFNKEEIHDGIEKEKFA